MASNRLTHRRYSSSIPDWCIEPPLPPPPLPPPPPPATGYWDITPRYGITWTRFEYRPYCSGRCDQYPLAEPIPISYACPGQTILGPNPVGNGNTIVPRILTGTEKGDFWFSVTWLYPLHAPHIEIGYFHIDF